MLISTKGRYALRVMIDLAEHRTDEFISLKGIAERQDISEKYLESIIAPSSRLPGAAVSFQFTLTGYDDAEVMENVPNSGRG